MSFTSKNLQYKKSGLTFIKGATLFFLGMSAVLFLTQAFDIVPSVTNRAQLIKEVLFTADGSQSGNTGAYIDGSGGNAYFAGTLTGTTICLAGDTCRTTWPDGGESLWSTGTNGIYYTGGNVGIGTTNPTEGQLQIDGNSGSIKIGNIINGGVGLSAMVFRGDATGAHTGLAIGQFNNAGTIPLWGGVVNYDGPLYLGSYPSVTSIVISTGGNVGIGGDLNLYSTPGYYGIIESESNLVFNTSGYSTPKMIINKSGYVGIGMGYNNPTTALQVSGDVTARAYYYNSDANMKTDLSLIIDPLSKILLLNGYMFTWKATDKRDMGVIAQEVEKVFPEIIHTDDQGYKSVEYGNLIAPLIEAIKELNQKLDEQAQKIQELEMK